MGRITVLTGIVSVSLLTFGLVGCSSKIPEPSPALSSGDSTDAGSEHGAHVEAKHANHDDASQTTMEKMKLELAKLSPEDAASAEKQHICPVSGQMLGTMGAPIKLEVDGQTIWICCDGCKSKLLANPHEYLAKLKQE